MNIDRSVASRLLAKVIARDNCGQPDKAALHLQALVHYLWQCGIVIEQPDAAEMARIGTFTPATRGDV